MFLTALSEWIFQNNLKLGFFMKILIVDDSRLSRQWAIQALPEALSRHAQILEADDGEKAIELYKEHNPALVLMDITMPNKNGFEALEDILKIDQEATVVMITADRQKITKERIFNLGAKGVLHKPLETQALRELLLELIQKEA